MYQCLATDFDKLEKRIKSISRQISTYGYKAEFKVLGREVKLVPVYNTDGHTKVKIGEVPLEVVNYDFYMDDFKVGNYYPVCLIEHNVIQNADIKNVIHWIREEFADPKNPDTKSWYNIDGHCDDCNDKYLRTKTVMLFDTETGKFRQIGMSCLKRYLGITSYNVIHNFMTVDEIINEEPAIYSEYVPTRTYVNTIKYLAHSIDLINEKGYIKEGKDATKDCAFQTTLENTKFPSKEAVDKAREIVEFFRTVDCSDFSTFNMSIKSAVLQEYTKKSGFVAFAPLAYDTLIAEIDKHNNMAKSEYIGMVGDKKVKFDLTVIKISGFDTQYGYTTVYTMVDDGNVVVWFTTSCVHFNIGDRFKAEATIKSHEEYNGIKQTVVTRLKKIEGGE